MLVMIEMKYLNECVVLVDWLCSFVVVEKDFLFPGKLR